MVVGETIYLLRDEGDSTNIIGVFKTQDAIIKFMKQEYNPYDQIDRDDFDTDEEYQEEIDEAIAALENPDDYWKLGCYIEENTMYKEV